MGDSLTFATCQIHCALGIVIRQSFYNTINSYVGVALGALNTMVLFPRLFPEDPSFMGEVQTILALATVYGSFGHLGLAQGLVRFFPRMDSSEQRRYWNWTLLLTSAIALILATAWFFYAKWEAYPRFYIYGIPVALSMVYFELFSSLNLSQQRVIFPGFMRQVFRRIIMSIALAGMWYWAWDLDVFMVFFSAAYLAHLIILIIQSWDIIPFSNNDTSKPVFSKKTLLNYGLLVVSVSTVTLVVNKIDVLMLRYLIGPEAVAFYTIAFFMGSVVGIPGRGMAPSLRPIIAKAFAKEDLAQIKDVYQRAARSQFLVNSSILLLLWAQVPWVFLLLPEVYREGHWLVFLIGLAQVIHTGLGPNGIIIMLGEKFYYNLYTGLALLVLTIGLNFLLISLLGIVGVGLSALMALGVYNIVKLSVVYREYKIWPYSFSNRGMLAAFLIFFILAIVIFYLINTIYYKVLLLNFIAFIYIGIQAYINRNFTEFVKIKNYIRKLPFG